MITFFIALSQLGPLLRGPNAGQGSDTVTPQQLDRLDVLIKTTDQEVSRILGLDLSPFVGDQSSVRELRSTLKEWLVNNTIRNDPEVKKAVNQVLNRRRQESDGRPG